jgi:Flp pilus assembly protein TadB
MRIITEFLELVGALTASIALSMGIIVGIVAAVCLASAGGCAYWLRRRRRRRSEGAVEDAK